MIRQPIISVMGHVDHGKTSLLDKIRSTAIANKEEGGITQHIGASEVPIDVINKICGNALKNFGIKITIPGLLFIDLPGHEAFTNLRKRGGSVSDLALLVVDVTKNFEPQTYEAIEILKEYKTPFIVVANKIDLINGWKSNTTYSFAESVAKQNRTVTEDLESRIYEIIGKLSELGINSERYDRVTNFQKEVMIVPLSAKSGEGIAELLLYATGLAQKFLEERLSIEVSGPGIGSILEKKEEKGLGTIIDVILYNGTLNVNDKIAFATQNGIGTAKIKAILRQKKLQELRDPSSKFDSYDEVSAAAGIRISGSGLEDALPGSMLVSTKFPNYEKEIKSGLDEAFAIEKTGIVLKTDTIGSMEAISKLLASVGVKISKKGLGKVTKRDVLDAYSLKAVDKYSAVVLSFNVNVEEEAESESSMTGVKIMNESIIYKVIDDYKEWAAGEKEREKGDAEKTIVFPGLIKVIPNTCFRVSHPAVFGVDVEIGRIKEGYVLIDEEGKRVGKLAGVQNNGVALKEAKKGESVAVSVDGATFGRGIKEHMEMYVLVDYDSEQLLKTRFSDLIDADEKSLLERIIEIRKAMK